MKKTPKGFKDFPEIPGESLPDRRVRYWKWRRSQGAHCGAMSKTPLSKAPNLRSLNKLVLSLLERIELLEKSTTKDGDQC